MKKIHKILATLLTILFLVSLMQPMQIARAESNADMIQRLRDSNFVFCGRSYAGTKNTAISVAEQMLSVGFEPAFVAGTLGNVVREGTVGMFENMFAWTKSDVTNFYGSSRHNYIAHMRGWTEWCQHGHDHSEYKQYSGKTIYSGFSLKAISSMLSTFQNEGWLTGFGLGCLQWTFGETVDLMSYYKAEAGSSDTITYAQCLAAEAKMISGKLSSHYARTLWRNQNSGNLNSGDAAYSAGYLVCVKYEIPADAETQGILRGNIAREIYNVMVPAEAIEASTLRFDAVSYPSRYVISNSGYWIKSGSVASNYDLVSITTEIKSVNGAQVSGPVTKQLSGKYFYIPTSAGLDTGTATDNGVKFSSIKTEGDYVWILTATDSAGRTLPLEMYFHAYSSGSIEDGYGNAVLNELGTPSVKVDAGTTYKETVLTWDAVDMAEGYSIIIEDSNNQPVVDRWIYDRTAYSAFLPAGSYKAMVTAMNSADVKESDWVTFTVTAAATTGIGELHSQELSNHVLYKLYNKDCSWLEAKALAESTGGHLMTITSAEEQNTATHLVSNFGKMAFIGAESFTLDNWRWITDEPMNYTNWNEGQPDNWEGKENCGHLYTTGKWNDVPCTYSDIHGYIAEYNPVSMTVDTKEDYYDNDKVFSNEDLIVNVTFADGSVMPVEDFTISSQNIVNDKHLVIVYYGDIDWDVNAAVQTPIGKKVTITLNKDNLDVDHLSWTQFIYSIESEEEGANIGVEWCSDNDGLQVEQYINNRVRLEGIRVGEYTLYAKGYDGTIYATYPVSVLPYPMESIRFTEHDLFLSVNQEYNMGVVFTPSYVEFDDVLWETSDSEVVTVTEEGIIKAHKAGTATITCSSKDNMEVSDSCVITVGTKVTSVIIDQTRIERDHPEVETIKLRAIARPTSATNKALTWTSSDPLTATVDDNGTLTIVGAGYARITARAVGGAEAVCEIIVHSENVITFPAMLKEIDDEAFMGATFEEVVIPEGMTKIGSRAFANCRKLALVHLPKDLVEIAEDAFDGCSRIVHFIKDE